MKHRLFIGFPLPQSQVREVATLQQHLDHLGLPVAWEPPEKLHLTLNFLGPTPAEKIPTLIQEITSACQACSAFSLQLYFLETLYQRHDQSLIYLAPQGDITILNQLQSDLSSRLDALEFPQPRRFLPHFTIGKLKRTDPVATKHFLDQLRTWEFSPLPPFTVSQINLYESLVSKIGSKFLKLHSFVLQ